MAVLKLRSLLLIALVLMLLALASGFYMKGRMEKYNQKGLFVFQTECGDRYGYLC